MPTDFLNSKSMLTPGAAGGMTMLISSTLASQFGLPAKWAALAISFTIGLLVFTDATVKRRLVRAALYVVNSLIIFAVAVGTNGVANELGAPRSASSVAVLGSSAPTAPPNEAVESADGPPGHQPALATPEPLAASSAVAGRGFFDPWFSDAERARPEAASTEPGQR